MYNPTQSDSYNEYIEIKNVGTEPILIENLEICNEQLYSGFINHIDGEIYQDNTTEIQPNQLAIITDGKSGTEVYNNFNIDETSISLHPDAATICTGLNNDHDIIIIKNDNEIFDAIHYYSNWGADNNGYSLCLLDEKWQECTQTPGSSNEELKQEYNIEINEFLPNPLGDDNDFMPNGEWIELKNNGDEINIENFTL